MKKSIFLLLFIGSLPLQAMKKSNPINPIIEQLQRMQFNPNPQDQEEEKDPQIQQNPLSHEKKKSKKKSKNCSLSFDFLKDFNPEEGDLKKERAIRNRLMRVQEIENSDNLSINEQEIRQILLSYGIGLEYMSECFNYIANQCNLDHQNFPFNDQRPNPHRVNVELSSPIIHLLEELTQSKVSPKQEFLHLYTKACSVPLELICKVLSKSAAEINLPTLKTIQKDFQDKSYALFHLSNFFDQDKHLKKFIELDKQIDDFLISWDNKWNYSINNENKKLGCNLKSFFKWIKEYNAELFVWANKISGNCLIRFKTVWEHEIQDSEEDLRNNINNIVNIIINNCLFFKEKPHIIDGYLYSEQLAQHGTNLFDFFRSLRPLNHDSIFSDFPSSVPQYKKNYIQSFQVEIGDKIFDLLNPLCKKKLLISELQNLEHNNLEAIKHIDLAATYNSYTFNEIISKSNSRLLKKRYDFLVQVYEENQNYRFFQENPFLKEWVGCFVKNIRNYGRDRFEGEFNLKHYPNSHAILINDKSGNLEYDAYRHEDSVPYSPFCLNIEGNLSINPLKSKYYEELNSPLSFFTANIMIVRLTNEKYKGGKSGLVQITSIDDLPHIPWEQIEQLKKIAQEKKFSFLISPSLLSTKKERKELKSLKFAPYVYLDE